MPSFKEQAIVLRSRPFGEADKTVTLFSRDRGKFTGLAKGARRIKSKFGARLEPFTYADFFLAHGRNLNVISQIETIKLFTSLRQGDKLNAAIYLIRLVDLFTERGQHNQELFDLLLNGLNLLERSIEPSTVVAVFNVLLASIEGLTPRLAECAVCGAAPGQDEGKLKINFGAGGVVCNKCASGNDISLSSKVAEFVKKIYTVDLTRLKKIEVDKKLAAEINRFFAQYLAYQIGQEPLYYEE